MKTMTLEKATRIVEEVIAGRKRLGKQYMPPYIMDDVLDALVMVFESRPEASLKDELTKVRRQLAACQNREKARQNKGLDKGDDSDLSGGTGPNGAGMLNPAIQLDMVEVPDPESTIDA